jgi:hypothetical protein
MSKVHISTTRASSRVTANTIVLALCTVGPRHGGKVAQILPMRACIYAGGSRQIYQVGGSSPGFNFIKSIVFRFRVSYSIIVDNGTNFTSKEFKNYYEGLEIKLKFASIAHPKTNGQVEKANGLICNGIKKVAFSTSRERQERLGRRTALRSLESKNYA